MKNLLPTFILIVLLISGPTYAQTAYQHVSDENIYSFIDEMATIHVIDANTAIKPYSRSQIAKWLKEAEAQLAQLSQPKQARLSKFMQEYALEAGKLKTGKATIYKKDSTLSLHLLPPEATWRDPLFRAVIRPVYGIRYFTNEKGGFYQSYGGLEGIGYVGTKFAGYASLRDNHNSAQPIALPTYFTQEAGGNYKNGSDYSEMRGGLTFTWKWGTFGIIKDHLQWGDNQNGSNILSGRTPSFPMLKLHLNPVKWFEFEYFHGWLISEEIDSVNSYYTSNGDYRAVFREKYIAANMYTFKPFKRLNISIGNSIIYSDVPVQPAYLIPFFFYKSVDHTLNHGIENQNSSLFLNISSRQIKHLHLYASVFVDEFSIERVTDPNTTNFVSYKGGFSLSGWPVKDLSFATELTRTTPITYKHRVPATTFESNKFNLGHYLKDNSQDFYASVTYSPWNTLRVKASYLYAVHGNEYQYVFGTVGVDEHPVLQDKTWTNNTITIRAEMLPFTNIRIFAEFAHGNITGYEVDDNTAQYYENLYTPEYLRGITNTFTAGFGIGF